MLAIVGSFLKRMFSHGCCGKVDEEDHGMAALVEQKTVVRSHCAQRLRGHEP